MCIKQWLRDVFAILNGVRRLLIRPGAIGDFVVSLPALEHLAAGYLEVWTGTATVALARFADAACSIASTGLDLVGVTETPGRLAERLRGFDEIVSWYGTKRPEFRDAVAGLPFTFHEALPPEGSEHATDFYLRQVGAATGGVPRIHCDGKREDFAVIHPFSGGRRKNWPLERFRALAKGIERVMPVRWCSGEDDPPLPEAVQIHDLYELACWLAKARIYVGNDSGITHIAAAAGTPTVALFGPASRPAVWAPRGEHVRILRFFDKPDIG
jgi:heptosyltransferase-3